MKPTKTDAFWLNWCKDELLKGNNVQIRASGYSMIPNIWKGNEVHLYAFPIEEVMIGDLIAFQRNEHVVLHRVVDKKNHAGTYSLTTQGDSNRKVDEPILAVNYIGKVSVLNKSITQKKIPSTYQRNVYYVVSTCLTYLDALKKTVKKLVVRLNQRNK